MELMLILAVIALMAVAFGGHIYGRGKPMTTEE